MSKRTNVILTITLLVIASLSYFYYLYNKPHRSVATEEASYSVTAEDLFRLYSINEAEANKLYLDKVLLVKGKIREVTHGTKGNLSIILETMDEMAGVSCSVSQESDKVKTLKKGESVQIKGLCTGMLMDVVLIDGSLENKE